MSDLKVNDSLFDNIRELSDSTTLAKLVTAINAVPNLGALLLNASAAGNLKIIFDDVKIVDKEAAFTPSVNGASDTIAFHCSAFKANIRDGSLALFLQAFTHEVEHYTRKAEVTGIESRLVDTQRR